MIPLQWFWTPSTPVKEIKPKQASQRDSAKRDPAKEILHQLRDSVPSDPVREIQQQWIQSEWYSDKSAIRQTRNQDSPLDRFGIKWNSQTDSASSDLDKELQHNLIKSKRFSTKWFIWTASAPTSQRDSAQFNPVQEIQQQVIQSERFSTTWAMRKIQHQMSQSEIFSTKW